MTVDLSTLWDYAHPAVSEERFRVAIIRAVPDDAFILQTQIARTWGDRFVVERDKVILRAALRAYAVAHAEGPWETQKPVSAATSA